MIQKMLGTAACALLVSLAGAANAEGKIVISNWDGYMPAELLANFTKETGVAIELRSSALSDSAD